MTDLSNIVLFILALLLCSCNSTKYLDATKGERLLVENKIKIESENRIKDKARLNYSLGGLVKQKPNSKIFGIAHVGIGTRIWHKLEGKETKFANWARRNIAEAPAVLDPELTERTRKNLANYMKQRGYLDATCAVDLDSIGKKKIKVNYIVTMGELFTIKSLQYESSDKDVLKELEGQFKSPYIGKGKPLDETAFQNEKVRLTQHLKNNGYAFFVPNFIEYVGDSTGNEVDVRINILPQSDTAWHKKYTYDDIATFTNLVPNFNIIREDTLIDNIYFATSDPQFQVRPSILRRAILIEPGALYNQSKFDQTSLNLNSLGIYRFISMRPVQDSLRPDALDVDIGLSPNKRFSLGGDADLNTNNNSVVGSWLLGLGTTGTFRNRNIFGGAEHLQTNLRYNIEFDLTNPDRPFNSQEASIQNDLTIPRFLDYGGMYAALNKLHFGKFRLLNNRTFEQLNNKAQTHVNLSYSYLDLIDFYSYNIFHLSYGYDLRMSQEDKFTLDNLGLDVLQPDTRPRFDSLFGNNLFIRNSFGSQLFTGFLLRNFGYTHNGLSNAFGEKWNFRLNTEISGFEINLLNRLSNFVLDDDLNWKAGDLEFSRFVKIDMDGTYTRAFSDNVSMAVRLGGGFASAFGTSTDVPYVKQFFIGGPIGMRAWRIREIGPGGWADPSPPSSPPYYQTGNMRFEANAELRFQLFWWFKGAIFLDAGNVWLLKNDPSRPLANLRWDSYNDIALGSGFGIRGDFDYFILRFDLGLPLRRPAADEFGRHWVYQKWSQLQLQDFNPNLAVGYPF